MKNNRIVQTNIFEQEPLPEIKASIIVVPVSGGKDSQACLKLAIATGKRVVGMFSDTKFEHPETYAHIEKLRKLYGIEIHVISEEENSVPKEILKWKRFPGMRHRFCTKNLKVRPSKRFYKSFAEANGPMEVWIGVRKDESSARKKRYAGFVGSETCAPHEFMSEYPKYLEKMGVMFRLPIIDWSANDVFDYLDGEENPLYAQGFNRVGCFPCLAAGDRSDSVVFECAGGVLYEPVGVFLVASPGDGEIYLCLGVGAGGGSVWDRAAMGVV